MVKGLVFAVLIALAVLAPLAVAVAQRTTGKINLGNFWPDRYLEGCYQAAIGQIPIAACILPLCP